MANASGPDARSGPHPTPLECLLGTASLPALPPGRFPGACPSGKPTTTSLSLRFPTTDARSPPGDRLHRGDDSCLPCGASLEPVPRGSPPPTTSLSLIFRLSRSTAECRAGSRGGGEPVPGSCPPFFGRLTGGQAPSLRRLPPSARPPLSVSSPTPWRWSSINRWSGPSPWRTSFTWRTPRVWSPRAA
jgi:hypothetical protein